MNVLVVLVNIALVVKCRFVEIEICVPVVRTLLCAQRRARVMWRCYRLEITLSSAVPVILLHIHVYKCMYIHVHVYMYEYKYICVCIWSIHLLMHTGWWESNTYGQVKYVDWIIDIVFRTLDKKSNSYKFGHSYLKTYLNNNE